jgi:hypothetical protein
MVRRSSRMFIEYRWPVDFAIGLSFLVAAIRWANSITAKG